MSSEIRDHVMMLRYERFRDVAITADELWMSRNVNERESVAAMDWAAEEPEPESVSSLLDELCFFHRAWNKKANRCRPPCAWKHLVDKSNWVNDKPKPDPIAPHKSSKNARRRRRN